MNIEDLMKAFEGLSAENQTLRNELASALQRLAEANARIKQLEGQAAKDSHNSSKPPSNDGFKEPVCKTQSLRERAAKRAEDSPVMQGEP